MSNVKPIGFRVLVKALDTGSEKVLGSGLIIPDDGKESKGRGTVVSLGTYTGKKEWPISVGQVVMFKKYSPEEVEVEGEKYFVVDVDDILAVVEG